MSETKISLKQGKISNLSNTSLSSGQILFAVNDSTDSGAIYLDYTNEGGTTNRIKMDMGAFPANKIYYGENPPDSPEEGLIWLNPEDDEAYVVPITEGGTDATSASGARTNLDVYSKSEVNNLLANLNVSLPITYGTTDLVPFESPLAQGTIYLVYE